MKSLIRIIVVFVISVVCVCSGLAVSGCACTNFDETILGM